MKIYLRKITANDTKKQIETTKEAFQDFFKGNIDDENGVLVTLEDVNRSKSAVFKISRAAGKANSYRFAKHSDSTLSNFLIQAFSEYNENDILKFISFKDIYLVDLITKDDSLYSTYDFLCEKSNTNIYFTDDTTDTPTSTVVSLFPRNRIIFGAPGTGKSYLLEQERQQLIATTSGTFERVTFHPEYTYGSFVGTYKPVSREVTSDTTANTHSEITYEYVPGPFMRVYCQALRNPDKPALLIIEEINRANAAAVFGDIFQLLDRNASGESTYGIHASEDMKRYLAKALGENESDFSELKLPSNMYIWATMNSADQGVQPMDTAFKRRWEFTHIGINDNDELIQNATVTLSSGHTIYWNGLRKAINDFLAKNNINEDKQIGPFFLGNLLQQTSATDTTSEKNGNTHEIDQSRFETAFKSKVLMYLFEDAAKQKRSLLFSGCETNTALRYSTLCEEFSKRGITIFSSEIVEQVSELERALRNTLQNNNNAQTDSNDNHEQNDSDGTSFHTQMQ